MAQEALIIGMIVGVVVWAVWRAQLHKRQQAALWATVPVVEGAVDSDVWERIRPYALYLPPADMVPTGLLLVNDGQDREALHLREALAQLYARQQIRPVAVVALPTDANRMAEYGTIAAPNAQGLGAEAAMYAQFVLEELLPAVQEELGLDFSPGQTAVLGASLGGLSAFDLAWNFPEVFGVVGVMSGSFWWRAGDEETAVPAGERIAHNLVRRGPFRPGQRFWFQAGTQDEASDRDQNGVIDAIQDTLELIDEMVELGYVNGRDVVYEQTAGGRHEYETWAKVLPKFLMWAFPVRKGAG